LILEFLSNIELYFCSVEEQDEKSFQLVDAEYHHATKVMRNKTSDTIFATDGKGKIYEGIINSIDKNNIIVTISKSYYYKNRLSNYTFCIPNLRNPDRFKFALEKCVEFGITNFVLFNSERSVNKSFNIDRINKILLSAMKQSLQSYLPKVEIFESTKKVGELKFEKILFEQNSDNKFANQKFDDTKNYYLIFGPEGGFSQKEILDIKPNLILNLAENRLRSETAIIKAASLISDDFLK
jgi:16S rRNA (uracil1498-N3)-methyltransferase